MRYAEVSVNSPVARHQTFSYSIPSNLAVDVGQAVWVPFGSRLLQGIVLELTGLPAVAETKPLVGIIEERPLLSPEHVSLACWISSYYLAPLFDAVALMLPPGFERRVITFISLPLTSDASYSPADQESTMLKLVREQGKVRLGELEKVFGKKKAQSLVSRLVRLGLAGRSYELESVKVKPKLVLYLSLAVTPHQALAMAGKLRQKRAVKQSALLEYLVQQAVAVDWAEVRQQVKCSRATADALVEMGLVRFQEVEVRREPISYRNIKPSRALALSSAQQSALDAIFSGLRRRQKPATSDVFLLHGVTGSGKTEVYLQALAEAVRLGKKGIVLVPEIALTPQTIERFAARFPHRVAVLHSRLSLGEQYDEWQRIKNGEFDVVIGSRSAVFAPQPDLGLIVIDEEHEWTYKQHDKAPRYHARDAAIKLADLTGAVVILGSATPGVETFYRAQNGDYHLLRLPERVVPEFASPLPMVNVVDLREELKAGNRSHFSSALYQAISQVLERGEQAILFLNRRGGAGFIQCHGCGFVFRCRRCEVTLTHHPDRDKLVCHQCGYSIAVPRVCPQCASRRLKFLGMGTQKLAQEFAVTFPQARMLRWDSDAAGGRHAHEAMLSAFRAHEADVLIGTQMIAKGLDFPLVTLVGVVNADVSLNIPDFRAGERTFQLISQVAGRAGRGTIGGRVIIQTFSPEHYAVQAAAEHSYGLFYEQEINYRRKLNNPPYTGLASLVFSHVSDTLCQQEAENMKRLLNREIAARGIGGIVLIGPAPAFIHRLRGRFRWQLIVRGHDLPAFLSEIPVPRGWTVDIDPVGLV